METSQHGSWNGPTGCDQEHRSLVNQETIMSNRKLHKLTIAMIAFTIAGTALASDPATDAPTVRVEYGDLNMNTRAGAEALHQRLRVAARSVCPDTTSRNLRTSIAGRQCVADAVNRAVADIAQPQLALVHAKFGDKG